jgi:hypothetical protein
MYKFNGWVKFRYEKSLSVWDHILLEIAGNEADALQLFWRWWDEFFIDYHNDVEIRCDFNYDDLRERAKPKDANDRERQDPQAMPHPCHRVSRERRRIARNNHETPYHEPGEPSNLHGEAIDEEDRCRNLYVQTQ